MDTPLLYLFIVFIVHFIFHLFHVTFGILVMQPLSQHIRFYETQTSTKCHLELTRSFNQIEGQCQITSTEFIKYKFLKMSPFQTVVTQHMSNILHTCSSILNYQMGYKIM